MVVFMELEQLSQGLIIEIDVVTIILFAFLSMNINL